MDDEEKIPWILGRPDTIYNEERMRKELGISTNNNGKISDFYVHYPKCPWGVIEWKDDVYRRLSHCIDQLQSTIQQIRDRKERPNEVSYAIIVKRSLGRESKIVDVDRRTNTLINKLSTNRNRLSVCGLDIRYFSFEQVSLLRNGRLNLRWV